MKATLTLVNYGEDVKCICNICLVEYMKGFSELNDIYRAWEMWFSHQPIVKNDCQNKSNLKISQIITTKFLDFAVFVHQP